MSSGEGGDGEKTASSGLLKMMEEACLPLTYVAEELNRETAFTSGKGSIFRLKNPTDYFERS